MNARGYIDLAQPRVFAGEFSLAGLLPALVSVYTAAPKTLLCLAILDSTVAKIVFGGTVVAAANHGLTALILAPSDQPQGSAYRAREHGPIRVRRLPHRPRVFEHK